MKSQDNDIIEKPELKSFSLSSIELGITGLAWGLWVYLIMPLFTLILWVLGAQFLVIEQVMLKGYRSLLEVAVSYLIVVFLIGVILVTWNMYNKMKFKNNERRAFSAEIDVDYLAESLEVSLDIVKSLQSARIASIDSVDGDISIEVEDTLGS